MVLARSVQCYLLCGVRVFQQSMRNVLTNVLVLMAQDFSISTSQKGSLLAAIPLGYFLTQVPGGALADRMGAKNVMLGALTLSACCCLVLPSAFELFGFYGLLSTLTLMGAVQGPMFPTSSVFLARWMPKAQPGEPDEKAWGTSMLDIGISVGTLLIIPTVTFLSEYVGWRHTYHTIGAASLAFCALFHFLGASSPRECWFITADEKAFLDKNVTQPRPKAATATNGSKNGANGDADHTLFARVPGSTPYYLTNWSPTYYKDVLGIAPTDAYVHLMIPHFTNLAAKSANPMIVGALASRGFSLLASRKAFTCAGFLLAAAVLLPVPLLKASSPWASTLLFSLANAFFGLAPSGFKANYLDITEEYVGIIAGYGNTLGTVASFVQPKLLARLLDATGATAETTATGSWTAVLATVAMSSLLASGNYALNATVSPIERATTGEKTK